MLLHSVYRLRLRAKENYPEGDCVGKPTIPQYLLCACYVLSSEKLINKPKIFFFLVISQSSACCVAGWVVDKNI